MFKAVSDIRVMSVSMRPVPFTWAKSRTRLSSALAIRGVPRDLRAISMAASSLMGICRICALRRMIFAKVSGS